MPDVAASITASTSGAAPVAPGRLACRRHGSPSNPALLFIHCIGLDGLMWDGLIDSLDDRYHVIVPDLPGHGMSAPAEAAYSIEEIASEMFAVLDASGAARAHVAGCSIGANIAMRMAADRPERVASLVLANGAPKLQLPIEIGESIAAAAEAQGMGEVGADLAKHWFAPDFLQSVPGRQWSARLSLGDGTAFAKAFRALLASDRTQDLAAIVAPTLVIAGAGDAAFNAEAAKQLASKLLDASAVVIPESGHLPVLERPSEFGAYLTDFLDRHG